MSDPEKIKIIRKALKKSQQEFAGMIGIRQNTYSLYETGVRDLPKNMLRILKSEYGLNPDWWEKQIEPMFISKDINNISKPVNENLTEVELLKKIINNLEDEVQFLRYLVTENNKVAFKNKHNVSTGKEELKQK